MSGHGSNGAKTAGFAVYGSSKAAISQITLSLAEELTHTNIKIIAPGLMKTDLSRKLLESEKMSKLQRFLFQVLSKEPSDVASKVVSQIMGGSNAMIIKGF